MKPSIKFFIQLIVSLGLIVALLKIVNPGKVVVLLGSINIWFFILLLLLITFDRIFMAYKWHLLMKAMNIKTSIYDAIRVYYIGTFASFFLPTTVGADLVRVYKLHSEKQEGTKVFSSVIIERLLGLIASALVAVLGILFLIYILKLDIWLFFWSAVLLLILFIIIFIFSFYTHFVFGRRVKQWMKEFPLFEKLKKVYKIYTEYKNKKPLLLFFIILSCLEQLVAVIGDWLASYALGLSIPFIYFLAVVPIVQLFNRIPVSFNGIGVNEALLVYFFALLGLQESAAFTIGLIGHVAILLSVLPVVFYLAGRHFIRK